MTFIAAVLLAGVLAPRDQFVATATGIGLVVDGARLPLYLEAQALDLSRAWATIAVGALVLALGIYMLLRSIAPTH